MRLTTDGITAHLPRGWEGGVVRPRAPRRRGSRTTGAVAARTPPAMHLANFPLPATRGDYGGGAVESMAAADAFVAVVEFGPECVGTALFARPGHPAHLGASDFHPRTLQRMLPGQAGCQVFFTESGRAFCLYAVLGSLRDAPGVLPEINAVLDALTIDPR